MIWVGTSGFQYPEWRGSFYPQRFPEKDLLRFYTEHFSTVEINYSFYRLPTPKTMFLRPVHSLQRRQSPSSRRIWSSVGRSPSTTPGSCPV